MDESRTIDILTNKSTDRHILISFHMNGRMLELSVEPTMRLIDIIRGQLDLTGTKISCGIGRCGACSVMMDGHLVNACLVMAYQVDQSQITTIEGINTNNQLHTIQKAFLEEGGFQCGYCTPGMVMAVKALIYENSNPTEEEIKEALSGNLCRCTGYGGIIRSVQRAIKEGMNKN
ncbi:(2Fe-2S)-binding protein [Aquibacillus albus]|uniref:Xanthine dehydrogenase E subunit n=1 Tax=Aquibacillus albus TaxID=1168171 RepID=A0ABS2MZ47_9BACI|nr:(2Fe-2S)-binding protein [Aquibacillus albus]MBM7571126.1 xanthine dehydrogenase E subunit [Aquibacillus albus]